MHAARACGDSGDHDKVRHSSMTTTAPTRRHFLQIASTAFAASCTGESRAAETKEPFKISLAEWSLNKRKFKTAGSETLDPFD